MISLARGAAPIHQYSVFPQSAPWPLERSMSSLGTHRREVREALSHRAHRRCPFRAISAPLSQGPRRPRADGWGIYPLRGMPRVCAGFPPACSRNFSTACRGRPSRSRGLLTGRHNRSSPLYAVSFGTWNRRQPHAAGSGVCAPVARGYGRRRIRGVECPHTLMDTSYHRGNGQNGQLYISFPFIKRLQTFRTLSAVFPPPTPMAT